MKHSFTAIKRIFPSQRFYKCTDFNFIKILGQSSFTIIKRTYTVIKHPFTVIKRHFPILRVLFTVITRSSPLKRLCKCTELQGSKIL